MSKSLKDSLIVLGMLVCWISVFAVGEYIKGVRRDHAIRLQQWQIEEVRRIVSEVRFRDEGRE